MGRMSHSRNLIAGLVLLMVFVVGWPALASSAKEDKIGREIYDQITAQIPVYNDPAFNDYVSAVGQKLAAHSDRPDIDFTFTVLDSPDINAFATPGGYVYINRGLVTYMKSEAQLAAVLAHEIAHITARHAARQQRAQTTTNVAATVLAVLSRSGDVGEATALWGTAAVRGYGRDMELEADSLGAKFMASAGYDRSAVIEVLSLLKDNERFEKRRARETGREARTYHGLFATHPRSDTRLQQVVKEASSSARGEKGELPFRLATDKLVWGQNFQASHERDNRYVDEQRLFRFDYPEGWSFSAGPNGVIEGAASDGQGSLSLSLMARTTEAPAQFIKNRLGIHPLRKAESFSQFGMPGQTGLADGDDGRDARLAVIYYGRAAVVFRGQAAPDADAKALDEAFLSIIRSFAPLSPRQLGNREPQRIRYVKATSDTTFAALASHLHLGPYGEDTLRLINGYYPRGEPSPGEWIKIIR